MRVWIVYADGIAYQNAQQSAFRLWTELAQRGLDCDVIEGPEPVDVKPDLVIAVGGDGTVTKTLKRFSPQNIPTIGLNAGDVGFLCAGETKGNWESQIADFADLIANKRYQVMERIALRVAGYGAGPFVNEVALVAHGPIEYPFALARFQIKIDGHVVSQSLLARGVIVSTPTGSTALNASSGGPIILPESKVLAVTPINGQPLNVQPFVVPVKDGSAVQVKLLERKHDAPVVLTADAANIGRVFNNDYNGIDPGQTVTIRPSDRVLLATRGSEQFFTAMQEKKGFAR